MRLNDCSETVLQSLEQHVSQMPRDVHEFQPGFADQFHFRGIEQPVMVLAHEPRILNGFLGKFTDIGFRANDSDVVRI